MYEPDFFKVDEAARLLCSFDQGQEIEPDVWANDTPEAELNEYRREAYRYALVAAVMNTPDDKPTDPKERTIAGIREALAALREIPTKQAAPPPEKDTTP